MPLIQPVALTLNVAVDGSASRWYPLGFSKAADGIEDRQQQVMPAAGTISNVRIDISVAPGATKSHTFTLKKNKVATSIVVTIANTAVFGTDTTHSVAFVAGDLLAWEEGVTGAAAAANFVSAYFEISGSAASYFSANNFTVSGDQGCSGSFQPSISGVTLNQIQSVWPVAGTITGLGLYQNGAGTTGSWSFRISKNGVDQDGAGGTTDTRVSISSSASPTTATGAFSLAVAAGDLICVKAVAVSSPSVTKNMSWGFSFAPTDGVTVALPQAGGAGSPSVNAATDFLDCVGVTYSPRMANATALLATLACSRTMQISAMYVNLIDASPGTAKSRTFTLQLNGSDQSLSVAIANAAQTGNDTAAGHKVNIASGDTLALKDVVVGTTVGGARITIALALGIPGGGKGAAGGSNAGGNKKSGGGAISQQTTGGAGFINYNPGVDIGITS